MRQSKKSSKTYNPKLVSIIIRIGLATVFIYAAIDAFRQPDAWISFIPEFSNKFIDAKTALDLISIFQLVLAVWLVTGQYIKYSALISAGLLGGIMVFNFETILITFHDIGLITAAISLIFLDE